MICNDRSHFPPNSVAKAATHHTLPVLINFVAFGFFMIQVVALPAAESMFRAPKLAVALAIIAVAAAVGSGLRLRVGELSIPRSPLAMALFSLPLLQMLSVGWSKDPWAAISAASVTAVWAVGFFWLATVGVAGRRRIVCWAGWGVGVSTLVMALQAVGLDPLRLRGTGMGVDEGLPGLAGNPSDAAMAAALMLPLVLFDGPTSKSDRRTWILPGLLVIAIVLSQSLTGYLALMLFGASLVVGQGLRRRNLITAAVAALAFIILFAANSGKVQDRFDRLLEGDAYQVLGARGDGWTAAAQMFVDHPFVGVGAGHYSSWFYPSRLQWLEQRGEIGRRGELATHFDWAHCDPLDLVAELGLVGVGWLVIFICTLVGAGMFRQRLTRVMVVVALPFLLAHYPSHVAVSMVPMSLA